MTVDQLKAGVPKDSRRFVTQRVVDILNQLDADEGPEFAEVYKKRFISHSKILQSGNYNMEDYLNAIRFVSYQLLQHNDIDSYQLAFPDRYQRLLDQYVDLGPESVIRSKKISSFVSEYKKNDLVANITEQALIAPRILNAPMYQEALNVQADLMMNARSETVRSNAADSILTHLKPPEKQEIELNIGLKENDAVAQLRKITQDLSEQQRIAIQSGASTSKDIAESRIIDVEEIE